METRSDRGQVIIELVLVISFFLLLAFLGHQQNEASFESINKTRFGHSEKQRKYYDTIPSSR